MIRLLLTLFITLLPSLVAAQSPDVDRCTAAVPAYGLDAVDMTDSLRAFFGVPAGIGVLITAVSGPAEAAGLVEGDVITQVGARAVYTVGDLRDTSSSRDLVVYRFGDPYAVSLIQPMVIADPTAMSCGPVMRWRGVGTLGSTPGLGRFFGAGAGVIVDRVTPGQCTDVHVGDVIVSVGETVIRSELDFGSLALSSHTGPLLGVVRRYGEEVSITWCE